MRLIDVDGLGVGRCSKDVLPAAYCAGWNGLLGLIEKAPTVDAAPVVHCKDCAHRTEMGNCGHPRYHGILPSAYPYDFCSYGAKMGGDSDALD